MASFINTKSSLQFEAC